LKKPVISMALLAVAVFCLTECSTVGYRSRPSASEYQRTYSYAIPQTDKTTLGSALKVKENSGGQSGFRILNTGSRSLDARLQIIQAAEKTLDLQYYAVADDVTSNLLIEAVIRAAERGVRVRFLIDDISVGDVQETMSGLDAMDNIEVRVFNPMTTGDQSFGSRVAGVFTDFGQMTKRMHNKAMIVDNQVAIVGGRNLGDEYFDADPDASFKDVDVLTAGPITAKISSQFDDYWNSENSFPISTLYERRRDAKFMTDLRAKMTANWNEQLKTPEGRHRLDDTFINALKNPDTSLVWAKADMVADDPEKIDTPEDHVVSKPLRRLQRIANNAESEFFIISSYFVPGDDGVAWLNSLEKRGVNVRILTNSLASTDVVAVHSGYRRYRKDLIKDGVDLYEFKPAADGPVKQRPLARTAPAYASLHAKIYMVDQKDIILGSVNFDPRSSKLNTELSLVIHSPELAKRLHAMFEAAITPEHSYALKIKDGSLVWDTKSQGKDVEYRSDPDAGLWRNLETDAISLLPVEDQL